MANARLATAALLVGVSAMTPVIVPAATPNRPATTAPATLPAKPYLGTFVYRYGDFHIKADVPDEQRLTFTVIAGMPGNPTEEVKVERRAIRPDIFLATWVEANGAAVTQVSDFTNMTATSTVVRNGQSTVFVGTLERVTP